MRNEKEEEEMKHCTFQPNFNVREDDVRDKHSLEETIDKLYLDGFKKQRAKKEEAKHAKKEIQDTECTFIPKVNRVYFYFYFSKTEVFEENPLIHDEKVKQNMERLERARIERKIMEYQKKKGITDLKNFGNLEELLKEHELPGWQFGMEKKTYKDSIEISTMKAKKSENPNITRDGKIEFILGFSHTMRKKTGSSQKEEPLLNIEVNIDNKNRVERLQVFPNDDPNQVAEDFCSKFSLSEEKKFKLRKIIEEKLSENVAVQPN